MSHTIESIKKVRDIYKFFEELEEEDHERMMKLNSCRDGCLWRKDTSDEKILREGCGSCLISAFPDKKGGYGKQLMRMHYPEIYEKVFGESQGTLLGDSDEDIALIKDGGRWWPDSHNWYIENILHMIEGL